MATGDGRIALRKQLVVGRTARKARLENTILNNPDDGMGCDDFTMRNCSGDNEQVQIDELDDEQGKLSRCNGR